MAAITYPRQRRRWGNESTNFFGISKSEFSHLPVPQKVYRCDLSQYTNAGHFHVGAKVLNGFSPQDRYGTPIAYKLRPEDQRLPRSLQSQEVHNRRMRSSSVDLYQSHQQSHVPHTMSSTSLGKSPPEPAEQEGVVQPLNEVFYTTTYNREISRPASGRSVLSESGSLTSRVLTRSRSFSTGSDGLSFTKPVVSLRHSKFTPSASSSEGVARRRTMSANPANFPSKGEMLKDINSVFPTPLPPPVSVWESRPSSAIKTNRIKGLRNTS